MEVYILNKYVDDVLSVVKSLELGTRWSKNNGLTHSVEDAEEDIKSKRSRQR